MERRHFIGALLASFASVVAPKPETLLWMPAPVSDLPPLEPGSVLTLNQVTAELLKRLINKLDLTDTPLLLRGIEKLGEEYEGVVTNQQYSISFEAPSTVRETGLDRERYIEPVAASLADRLRRHRHLRGFGELFLPGPEHAYHASRVSSEAHGMSVRGLMNWEFNRESYLFEPVIRFDVLVAAEG